jgi:hypothetical protein
VRRRKGLTNDLDVVWRWFEFQRDLIGKETDSLRDLVAATGNSRATHFLQTGMTTAEVRDFFANQREELDLVVMLELVAATEGILGVNFL